MFIVHFKLHKPAIFAAAVILVSALALALVLPGCHADSQQPIPAETEEQRLAYLTELGWTVNAQPIETLDLQLPASLEGDWENYAALQDQQGLPFRQFAGQTVRRYTYTVTNFPNVERGVQVNLYVSGGQLIGGDVISTGKDEFQQGLEFPKG